MTKVAIVKDAGLVYPREAPFHPSVAYPEALFSETGPSNGVYERVRELLWRLGLDREHYGTPAWNPLGEWIEPGQTVLLKPNCVMHFNPEGSLDSLFTHGSVVRSVLDYVAIALRGEGKITIGDAPLQSGDFQKVVESSGIARVVDFYAERADVPVELVDLRLTSVTRDDSGFLDHRNLEGDHTGYTAVDLGRHSALCDLDDHFEQYRVTNYDSSEMTRHHNRQRHEYLISNSVLAADVIVNLPKMKTHRKVGMTCALKNLVGLNGSKDWLPHHRFGSVAEGGDEYPTRSLRKRMVTRLQEARDVAGQRWQAELLSFLIRWVWRSERVSPQPDAYREGSWYGNETLPRTLADLNRLAVYADKQGTLRDVPQRSLFAVVDAVVAGEREGPVDPDDRHCGVLVAGANPVAVDLACSRIMGFDHRKIPTFACLLGLESHRIFEGSLDDIEIASERCTRLDEVLAAYGEPFVPTLGWQGHIEHEGLARTAAA